jgi:hypothetical protein
MRALVSLLAVALCLAASGASAADPEPSPDNAALIPGISPSDARALLTGLGVKVENTEFAAGHFTITAAVDPTRHVWLEGLACAGDGEAAICPQYKISAHWALASHDQAVSVADKLSYSFSSVATDGPNLDLWRMEFVYGGVTRDHVRQVLKAFLILRADAADDIWTATHPAAAKPGPPAKP